MYKFSYAYIKFNAHLQSSIPLYIIPCPCPYPCTKFYTHVQNSKPTQKAHTYMQNSIYMYKFSYPYTKFQFHACIKFHTHVQNCIPLYKIPHPCTTFHTWEQNSTTMYKISYPCKNCTPMCKILYPSSKFHAHVCTADSHIVYRSITEWNITDKSHCQLFILWSAAGVRW
jgi:hypothetical protein